jgi:oligopeptide transport system ATP-binding protein
MYLGSLVEVADAGELYDDPVHPYAEALISAVPRPDPVQEKERIRIMLEGDVPSPIGAKKECRFAGRCRFATDLCRNETPQLSQYSGSHFVACHHAVDLHSSN